jgi:hypothetical protein
MRNRLSLGSTTEETLAVTNCFGNCDFEGCFSIGATFCGFSETFSVTEINKQNKTNKQMSRVNYSVC